MPTFRTVHDANVPVEKVAEWFVNANNDDQILFLNEVAAGMRLDFNGMGQLDAIAHPHRSLNIRLTKQAREMLYTLADMIREEQ